jgi:hypothetical protein
MVRLVAMVVLVVVLDETLLDSLEDLQLVAKDSQEEMVVVILILQPQAVVVLVQ